MEDSSRGVFLNCRAPSISTPISDHNIAIRDWLSIYRPDAHNNLLAYEEDAGVIKTVEGLEIWMRLSEPETFAVYELWRSTNELGGV